VKIDSSEKWKELGLDCEMYESLIGKVMIGFT